MSEQYEQLELPFDDDDVIKVRFADRARWLEANGYPQTWDQRFIPGPTKEDPR